MTISSTEGSKEPAANFPAAAVDDEVDAATSNSTDANTPKSSKHHLQAEGDEGKEEQRKETEPDTKAESQETGDDDQNNSSVGENRSQSDITSSDSYHKEADQEEKEITVPSTANTRAATRRLKLPKACFCPISNYTKIMEDPVVHPDGESYEKVAISKQDPDAICYPNRALKAFIERELERSNTNGSNWESLLQNVALPFTERNPLPESFICPISFDFMFEPVIDKDGYTYEQEALISWIKVSESRRKIF